MIKNKLLKSVWEVWKAFGHKLGDFQARLVLSIFYFIVVAPLSPVIRFNDPLSLKPGTPKGWVTRGDAKESKIKRAMEQF